MLPSSPVAPASRRGYLSVVAIAKNEASYLVEWLEFHRLCGVDHIYLYDNGSTDQSVELLRRYISEGFVTLIPWASFDTRRDAQRSAYAHALRNFGPAWHWMTFIDLDEFLFPRSAGDLRDVLRGLEHQPAVAVPWSTFGFGGHRTRPVALVTESYTRRAVIPSDAKRREERKELLKWKSIVRPEFVIGVEGAHFFALAPPHQTVDESGQPLHRKAIPQADRPGALQLNHYFTKSEEEFAARTTRLRTKGHSHLGAMIEAETVEDGAIIRLVPALRAAVEERSRT